MLNQSQIYNTVVLAGCGKTLGNKLRSERADRLMNMRGQDHQQSDMFSYLSPEQRVRADHPLRAIRAMSDLALWSMSARVDEIYSQTGRPSIPPEKLLRAQLIQMLYSVRSERLLMEEIDYSILFRWFVGMNLDEPVWDVTVFTNIATGSWKAMWRASSWLRWC